MMAIHKSSRWIKNHNIKNDAHTLLDSQAAIKALEGSVTISKVTLEYRNS